MLCRLDFPQWNISAVQIVVIVWIDNPQIGLPNRRSSQLAAIYSTISIHNLSKVAKVLLANNRLFRNNLRIDVVVKTHSIPRRLALIGFVALMGRATESFEPDKGCGLHIVTGEGAIHKVTVSYYDSCWMEIGRAVESAARTRDQQHMRLNYFIL
ncbi:hypothetical protein GQ600_7722 [Phytophthora cactorum]|nr:hypothetical protein GQ600_7722 [Phytophthora cactorum]